ncbi:MAG: NAD-dependent epimerase/dehydratase family protein [Clostridiales bacterium]|nr:NAD-dependent epimerase/dehydratase family protein [Clostridiales bacterium]
MADEKLSVLTGATGHVGYALLVELLNSGEKTRILIRKDTDIFDGLDCEKAYGDVTDPASLERAFEGADTVYHSAGMIEINKGGEDIVYNVNVTGTKNVVAACKKCGVKKLVYMSSVDAYPPLPNHRVMTEIDHYDPNEVEGVYAKTKAEATQYVLDQNGTDGLETVVVQPSACIGPYDFKVSSVGAMVRMYIEGKFPVSLSFGGYNFVDVRDVAYGSRMAAEKGTPGECYILCGDAITVDEFIKALALAVHKNPPKLKLGKGIVNVAAPLMEAYYNATDTTPLLTRYAVRKLVSNCNFSYEKAKRDLGYNPMSVNQSAKDMIDWIVKTEGDPKDPAVKKRKKEAKKAEKAKKKNK